MVGGHALKISHIWLRRIFTVVVIGLALKMLLSFVKS